MSDTSARDGWRSVSFGDVVRLVRERSSDPNGEGLERYVGLEHIQPGDLRVRRWGNIADGTTFTNVFHSGQVLFGKRRAYQRKLAVPDFDGVCSGDIYVLEPRDKRLLSELLPFICQTNGFFEHAVGTSAGSLSPRTNWDSLATYEFALPPPDYQHRLVQALTCLDDCLEHCNAIRWRVATVVTSLLELMWSQFPLGKIQDLVDGGAIAPPQDGNHGEKHPTASDYIQSGIPFVMASDLREGLVDFDGCKKIPASVANGLRIGFARHGDVLLSHKGTVGEVARLLNPPTDVVMLTPQVTYYRVTDPLALHPDWLFFSFQSPGFQRMLKQYGKQSTRAYVGITAQRELRVPQCPLDQQLEFLDRLWSAESAMTAAHKRAEELAGLRKALFGKAVPGA